MHQLQTARSKTDLEQKIPLIKRIVQVRGLYVQETGEAIGLSEALLDKPNLDPAVRIRDVFGFLVDHDWQQGNFNKASRKLEKLQKRVSLWKVWCSISPASLKGLQKHTGLMFDHNPYVNEDNEVEEA